MAASLLFSNKKSQFYFPGVSSPHHSAKIGVLPMDSPDTLMKSFIEFQGRPPVIGASCSARTIMQAILLDD